MIYPEVIINILERNYAVAQLQVDGLSHDESVLQLPFPGNCLNWVMGHIVTSRQLMLELVGEDKIWDAELISRYRTGSDPVTGAEDGLPFDQIMGGSSQAHEILIAALNTKTVADLAVVQDGQERTIGQRLVGLSWHEAYHVGQTELYRQLSGKNDQVP